MHLLTNVQWFEVLDGLLGKHWRNVGLAFNCTFLLFGSVIQLIACARYHAPVVCFWWCAWEWPGACGLWLKGV
jgi:hypothetical protein